MLSFTQKHQKGWLMRFNFRSVVASVVVWSVVCPAVCSAVDGTCWQNYTSPAVKWSQHTYSWVNCIVARERHIRDFPLISDESVL